MPAKRMHPINILVNFIKTIRNSLVIIIYLFMIRLHDPSTMIIVLRYLLIAFLIYRFGALILQWWTTKYRLKKHSVHLEKGLFNRKESRIPIDHIQNVQWQAPVYYRPFRLATLSLQTSRTDEEGTIHFEAISQDEAKLIEQTVLHGQVTQEEHFLTETEEETDCQQQITEETGKEPQKQSETLHYRPSKRELWQASFLSFSVFALFPIIVTVYHEVKDVINLDRQAKGLWNMVVHSWLWLVGMILLFLIIAVAFGVVKTFLTYGKHEIASDAERIYIRTGTVNRSQFSVTKSNIQAVQFEQSPLKKWFGLLELNVITAGAEDNDDDEQYTLYPYLPRKKAFQLLQEMLPNIKLQQTISMTNLPKAALKARLYRLPWIWAVATIVLIWWKSEWWYLSPVLFVLTYLGRYFQYRNTRYMLNDSFIQLKTGGWFSRMYVTERSRIIEIEIEQSLLQKGLKLASLKIYNRTKPSHEEEIKDVPLTAIHQFKKWYYARSGDVTVDHD